MFIGWRVVQPPFGQCPQPETGGAHGVDEAVHAGVFLLLDVCRLHQDRHGPQLVNRHGQARARTCVLYIQIAGNTPVAVWVGFE